MAKEQKNIDAKPKNYFCECGMLDTVLFSQSNTALNIVHIFIPSENSDSSIDGELKAIKAVSIKYLGKDLVLKFCPFCGKKIFNYTI